MTGTALQIGPMTKQDKLTAVMDPAQEAFEIHEWPFYHLARVTSLYTQRMDAALKPLGIDVPRWRVLALLRKNGASTVTQLSQEAVSKISTMTKIIQRMTAEKLVTVRPSSNDARSTEVIISESGMRILEDVREKVGRIGHLAFDGVVSEELERLNVICRKIYLNLLQ